MFASSPTHSHTHILLNDNSPPNGRAMLYIREAYFLSTYPSGPHIAPIYVCMKTDTPEHRVHREDSRCAYTLVVYSIHMQNKCFVRSTGCGCGRVYIGVVVCFTVVEHPIGTQSRAELALHAHCVCGSFGFRLNIDYAITNEMPQCAYKVINHRLYA